MLLELIKKVKNVELTLTGGFAIATIWLWMTVILEAIETIIKCLIGLLS